MTAGLFAAPGALGPARFAILRMALGLYLLVHFSLLIPWAAELYGPQGMLPDASLNMSALYLPPTPGLFASARSAQLLLATLAVCAGLLAGGVLRRTSALLLWVGLVLLLHRNNLTYNVSLPYVGWLLLASLVVPLGEGGLWTRRDPAWKAPPLLLLGAWAVFGLTYSYSGWMKLQSPEWRGGEAIGWIIGQPIAIAATADLLGALPDAVLRGLTWLGLGLELLCAPLVLVAPLRAVAWTGLTLMQIGLLGLLHLHDLTLGVLLFHLLLFDPAWLERLRALRPRPDQKPSSVA